MQEENISKQKFILKFQNLYFWRKVTSHWVFMNFNMFTACQGLSQVLDKCNAPETDNSMFNAIVAVKISFLETKLSLKLKVLLVNTCKTVHSNKSSD